MSTNVEAGFWKDKRVFITGHTGFKGSWLSLWLKNMGSVVRGYALEPPTQPSLFKELKLEQNMESHIGDICDIEKVSSSLIEFNPDIIFHMAAQPLVRLSYEQPISTYTTNVIGTANVLEVARKCINLGAIVNVTTDKCYKNREWQWGYRENEPMGGYDPYSSSKACSELVTAAYRSSFFDKTGVGIASARAGNVIGGGDWALDRLVPDALRAFEKKQLLEIRNPQAIRPWQHVLEPLSGYIVLAQCLFQDKNRYAEAWNFGPNDNDAKTVEWIVKTLISFWGDGADWFISQEEHPYEAHYLKLDCSKSKSKLAWGPKLNLRDSLKNTVDWHQSWLSGQNMFDVSLKEIEQYMLINLVD